jgi:uncharacterized protein YkwD
VWKSLEMGTFRKSLRFSLELPRFEVQPLRVLRALVTFVALILCALVAAAARPDPAKAITTMEKRLVAKINDARASRGLRRLRTAAGIQRNAHRWARYLMQADAFYHGSLAQGSAENIAWGTCGWMTPARMVRMWLASSSHRAHLLDRSARRVGAGVTAGRWRGYSCTRIAVVRFR